MVHVCGEALGLEHEIMKFYWSTWDITDRCAEALELEQERIKCWSTQDMALAFGEALGSEQKIIKLSRPCRALVCSM